MGQFAMRAVLFASCAASVAVGINIFFMQSRGPGLTSASIGAPQMPSGRLEVTKGKVVPPPVADTYRPRPVVNRELVGAIQRELYAGGYTRRPPDGVLDIGTRAAILAWESENGVTLTAIPSESLLKSLLLGASVDQGARKGRPTRDAVELIRHVQARLRERRVGDVQLTGRLDEATRRAIMAFEKSKKMTARGTITEELVLRLERIGRHG